MFEKMTQKVGKATTITGLWGYPKECAALDSSRILKRKSLIRLISNSKSPALKMAIC